MSVLHDGRPKASLSASNPSQKTRPALFLSPGGQSTASRGLLISAGGIIGGARDTEAEQPLGRFAGLRRGTDDGAIVLAQHIQPRTNVVGMPHGRYDSERCT